VSTKYGNIVITHKGTWHSLFNYMKQLVLAMYFCYKIESFPHKDMGRCCWIIRTLMMLCVHFWTDLLQPC